MAGLDRAKRFCDRFGLRVPVLQAPMAGSSPVDLAVAVAEAGGMGGLGALVESPDRISAWMEQFRARSSGRVQINLWIPGQPHGSAAVREQRVAGARSFLARFGPPGDAGQAPAPPVFREQCEAVLAARPEVVSSMMGLFEPEYVDRLHAEGIAWFACATNLDDALAAQHAGADVVVAQGMEAGGHRGSFDQDDTAHSAVGLFALLPWFADRLSVPVVAAGAIADGRGTAAALALGAGAVQVGTGLLACPETGTDPAWVSALRGLAPDATVPTRAYTGRLARAVSTEYLRAWDEPGAPSPAPFPDQMRLVAQWRRGGGGNAVDPANHWAGQGAALATEEPAGELVARMWHEASALLS
jgi:nitronate monooxygenase